MPASFIPLLPAFTHSDHLVNSLMDDQRTGRSLWGFIARGGMLEEGPCEPP